MPEDLKAALDELQALGFDLTDPAQSERNNAALDAILLRNWNARFKGTAEGEALAAVFDRRLNLFTQPGKRGPKSRNPRQQAQDKSAARTWALCRHGRTISKARRSTSQKTREAIAAIYEALTREGKRGTYAEVKQRADSLGGFPTPKQIKNHLPDIKRKN